MSYNMENDLADALDDVICAAGGAGVDPGTDILIVVFEDIGVDCQDRHGRSEGNEKGKLHPETRVL